MRFWKIEGAGNDFVCLYGPWTEEPSSGGELARWACDRRRGVGADGVAWIGSAPDGRLRLRIWNADGTVAPMCGNALRCAALLVAQQQGWTSEASMIFQTDSGERRARVLSVEGPSAVVQSFLGRPRWEGSDIPFRNGVGGAQTLTHRGGTVQGFVLTVGTTQCVIWVDDVSRAPVETLGREIAGHPDFPQGTNVAFAEVISGGRVRQRTFERGVGETLACGTGAAAVCAAGVLTGRSDRQILVSLPGGDLRVHWPDPQSDVEVEGPARLVFEGHC